MPNPHTFTGDPDIAYVPYLLYHQHSVTTILQVVTLISFWKKLYLFPIAVSLCTCRRSNEVFRKSPRPSLPLKRAPPLSPSPFFSWRRLAALGNLKASFHCAHLHNLSPQGTGDVTALRCSEPLRYRVGGASKPSPGFAGWDRQAITCWWRTPG